MTGNERMSRGIDDAARIGNTLMVFFRYPVKGHVKTRLAREMGDDAALKVYKTLLRYTVDIVKDLEGVDILLVYEARGGKSLPRGVLMEGWAEVRQADGDMGQRFLDAFRHALDNSAKAVIIGTDCIGLSKEIIDEAFDALEKDDVVIGPSEDGGYYLIGMKGLIYAEVIFTGIPWGTDKVFERTMEKMDRLRIKVHRLPKLFDVDTVKDWERSLKADPRLKAMQELVEKDRGWA